MSKLPPYSAKLWECRCGYQNSREVCYHCARLRPGLEIVPLGIRASYSVPEGETLNLKKIRSEPMC